MATVSNTLNQDIYVLLDVFKERRNFEAMFLMNQAIDLSDQISKYHLPTDEFFARLTAAVKVAGENDDFGGTDAEALKEVLDLIEEHRKRYL